MSAFADEVNAEIGACVPVGISYTPHTADEERRFHIWFAYPCMTAGGDITKGFTFGDEVVMAATLEQAAHSIMRSRGVRSLYVRKRFMRGEPAADAVLVRTLFNRED